MSGIMRCLSILVVLFVLVACQSDKLDVAIEQENYGAIRQLINQGANPFTITRNGSSALKTLLEGYEYRPEWLDQFFIAHHEGLETIFRLVAENNLDERAFTQYLENETFSLDVGHVYRGSLPGMLIQAERTDLLMVLLKHAKQVDAALMLDADLLDALLANNAEVVELLLNYGANPDAVNDYGDSALILAASSDYAEVVQLLIQAGASLDGVNRYGEPAILYASDAIKRQLLEAGASTLNDKLLADDRLFDAVNENNVNRVAAMLNSGANANAQNSYAVSVLFEAVDGLANKEIIQLLVNHGAQINEPSNGESALHNAASNQSTELATLDQLISLGANIEARNRLGETPLLAAVNNDNYEILKWLLQHGANVNAVDAEGKSVLHKALDVEKVKWFFENTDVDIEIKDAYGFTPLFEAIISASNQGDFEIFNYLLEIGADVYASDDDGRTALHLATVYAHWRDEHWKQTIDTLLDYGSAFYLEDNVSLTPLLHALAENKPHIAQYMIDMEAEIDLENSFGYTPACVAARYSADKSIAWLIELGVDFNEFCGKYAPIHFLIDTRFVSDEYTKSKALDVLLTTDIDTKVEGYNGVTAIDLASTVGFDDLISDLQQHGQ